LKRWLAALLMPALLAGVGADASAQDRRPDSGPPGARLGSYANPSAAIAAELAFARLAQEKGQWTAFKATAADDAVMAEPQLVLAQVWLNNRPNPPVAVAWQPHQVWSSCDGSVMVTTGAWQRAGSQGWYTTVWQRQKKGGYKWVFDHGDETKTPIAPLEMIAARVAECPPRRARPAGTPPDAKGKPAKAAPVALDPLRREGRSDDGTLTWLVTVDAAGARQFTARIAVDGATEEFRNERVAGG
jgi:hypothetical protein